MNIDMENLAHATRYGHLKEDSSSIKDYLTYSDRESYVAWRASWKAAYKSTSQKIRELKAQRKLKNRPANVSLVTVLGDLWRQQNIARSLLVIRKAGKEDSRARRAARHRALRRRSDGLRALPLDLRRRRREARPAR